MRRRLHRITAAVLLLCYGLAVTVSGAFHTEHLLTCGCGESTEDRACCDSHCHHEVLDHGIEEGLALDHAGHPDSVGRDSRTEECPVCAFLSHKPLPVVLSGEVVSAGVVETAPTPKALAGVQRPLSAIWSRGPPSLV